MATKRAKKEETTTAFRSFIRQIETRNVRNVAFLFLLLLLSLRPSLDRPPLPSPRRGHRDGEIKRRRGRMRNMIKKKKKKGRRRREIGKHEYGTQTIVSKRTLDFTRAFSRGPIIKTRPPKELQSCLTTCVRE